MVCSVVVLISGIILYPKVAWRVDQYMQKMDWKSPKLPFFTSPNASADRVTARRLVVASLHEALAQKNYEEAAMLNAILSQEASQRAYRALQAWETLRYPETGSLVPYSTSSWHQEWRPGKAGGNLFAHLVIASHFLDPSDETSWEQSLAYEQRVCGKMPCNIELKTGKVLSQEDDVAIEGAVNEYARDGLLAISERFGRGPWFERLLEVTDAILESANIETQYGYLISNATEMNGNFLQTITRLYWITGDERYRQMAERIADVYLFEIMPQYDNFLTNYWDFEAEQPLGEDTRFRPGADPMVLSFNLMDHGGEIIAGLGEFYFMEKMNNFPEAEYYRQPIQDFFDKILMVGRTPEGLWYRSVDTTTMEPHVDQILDTWGYNLSGLQAFDIANGSDRYNSEIEAMMLAVSQQHSISWEWGPQQDGYADTIESMLYLLPWHDLPEANYWVDDEIEVMFLKQLPSGFVEYWHLDGNFIRTALLYAQYKTQGISLSPWAEQVRLGTALDKDSQTLYIHLAAENDWDGKLRFDIPRHKTIWNMPAEYPRVNGMPEWYVVELDSKYLVTNLDTGEKATYTGQQLADGLPVTLVKNVQVQLTVIEK